MERHHTELQRQVNRWLELEKAGLSATQRKQFTQWIAANNEHKKAYEQSKQIDALLIRFSEAEQAQLTKTSITKPQHYWTAAACVALCMFIFLGSKIIPPTTNSTTYSAQYHSAQGELLDLALPDGSQLNIDAKTKISLSFDGNNRANKLMQGRVLFNVAPEAQRPFVIDTLDAKITVLGTKFSVDKKHMDTTVAVQHGRVKVEHNSKTIELTAGQVAVLNKQGLTVKAFNSELNFVDAWKDGRLVFDHTPLHSALEEFARHHHYRFTYTEQAIKHLPISGTFLAKDLETFLKLLPEVQPAKARMYKNHIVITGTN